MKSGNKRRKKNKTKPNIDYNLYPEPHTATAKKEVEEYIKSFDEPDITGWLYNFGVSDDFGIYHLSC